MSWTWEPWTNGATNDLGLRSVAHREDWDHDNLSKGRAYVLSVDQRDRRYYFTQYTLTFQEHYFYGPKGGLLVRRIFAMESTNDPDEVTELYDKIVANPETYVAEALL